MGFLRTDNLESLSEKWLRAKEAEREAVEERRNLEDRMLSLIGIATNAEGTTTAKPGPYTVKVVSRLDRKVDADKVQDLAAEYGLTDHLSSLFRWKPDLNMSAWKAADKSITDKLAGAITIKPGRPSFSIVADTQS